jgi:hypothetical protein
MPARGLTLTLLVVLAGATPAVVRRRLRAVGAGAAVAAFLAALVAANTPAVASVPATTTQAVAGASSQGVTRFVVEQRRLFADGKQWGSSGAYERLDGRAYMQVDPRDPQNAVIVNLDKAPRNAQGMVEFSSPFFILKPVDMRRGNHKLFFGINNRGNKLESSAFLAFPNGGVANNDPLTAQDVGLGFLLRRGYTIVDAGWQGDVAP